MFDHLHIYDPRERAIVGAIDAGLRAVAPLAKAMRPRGVWPPARVLLLRLERIGDLVMTLDAIADVRAAAPLAEIDLVVGSWNLELARRIPGITRVESLDAAWLARGGTGLPLLALTRRARQWRQRRYDLGINFEPDLRSNFLISEARAARSGGFASGGGGALLDTALRYDPRSHTSANVQRLVAAMLDVPLRSGPARIVLGGDERRRAGTILGQAASPLVGIHVSGGRPIKQWDPERFRVLAARLAQSRGATIVLTGSDADRTVVAPVMAGLTGIDVRNVAGMLDLATLAALIERLDVLVTGDTGPMHVAAAVGTPVVAVFGPSDPARYAPRDPMHRVVRIDLPCSPCNRIRLPPERCAGHIPDCLTGVDVQMVYQAVEAALDRTTPAAARTASARR